MKNQTDSIEVKDPEESIEEEFLFTSLRAGSFSEFYGQKTLKKSLLIAISAAKKRQEALEHVLLYGPPGLGKTTISLLIAKEMGKNIKITSGPALERAGDLASILTNLDPGDILFIDEIHRLSKVVEETLYPAMEDYCLDIVIGKGPSARTVRLDLPNFTIIGATTRVGLVASPLRDRFGVVHRLDFYSPDELKVITKKAAQKLKVEVDDKSLTEIAVRSRGTPRIALKLLKRARDFALVEGEGQITYDLAQGSFSMIEVDSMGLDSLDTRYILAIIDKHQGGPVGIETIASTISEDIGTLEDMTEPYLMQVGFIKRTKQGRVVTARAYKHFGIAPAKHHLEQKPLL